MKGFIEVFNTNNNRTALINIQYIQAVWENKIAIYDGSDIDWIIDTKENYKELKQKIAEAVSNE